MTSAALTARPAAAGARAGLRLRGRAHRAALTTHVLASVGWFGGAGAVAFCAVGGLVADDPGQALALHRTLAVLPWLTVPLGLVAAATGALLGVGTTWGLLRHWWVVAKIALTAAVLVTDPLVVAGVAHDVVAGAAPASALLGPTLAHVVVLGVATGLSVFKPRGRTPLGRRRAGA